MNEIITPGSHEEAESLLAADATLVQLSAGSLGGAVIAWPGAKPEEERVVQGHVYRMCNKQQAVFVRLA